MIAMLILYLREGFECSLVVSILLAALRQLHLRHQAKAVWAGVALAVLGSLAGASVLYLTIHAYQGTLWETLVETVMYVIAVVLLTATTFWMQQHSCTLKQEIVSKASMASSGFALGLLAFTSVGREGLETAFFTLGQAFSSNDVVQLIVGALLGLLLAVGLSFLIYRLGYRLNFRIFFRVMGLLLLFFAAGLLGNAIQVLQDDLGWFSFASRPLWDISRLLPQEEGIGGLLHGLLGYADAPSLLHAIVYLAFLAVSGTLFWHNTRKQDASQAASEYSETVQKT